MSSGLYTLTLAPPLGLWQAYSSAETPIDTILTLGISHMLPETEARNSDMGRGFDVHNADHWKIETPTFFVEGHR